MLSDVQAAIEAEAELDGMNPGAMTPEDSPEQSQVESDQEDVVSEEVLPAEVEVEEAEVVELPEDHDPNATLVEGEEGEESEEKVPQHRADAKNLAEKWDMLSDTEQVDKIERLRKSGRKQTIDALASELGTTTQNLLNPEDALVEKETEVEALKAKLSELEGVMGYAAKQAELDRFDTQMSKWASHNKLNEDEKTSLLAKDGELRQTFEKVQFHPETGEKLSISGRLRVALNQTSSIQDMLVSKKAKTTAEEMNEGLKAALPGTVPALSAPSAKREEDMTAEEWLQASDRAMGVKQW